jgi:LysR family transcriptional regulator, regulator for metE and metH
MKRIPRPRPPAAPRARPALEVRDLELVLALTSAGTTAGAASTLHVTQSAVSRALGQVEERLGVRLFERTARGVAPTGAGVRLVAGAGLLLSELIDLERATAAPVAEPARVRLVCECYTAYRWLPSAVVGLRPQLPELEVDVVVEHTHDPVGALLRGDIDLALLTTSPMPTDRAARATFIERPLFSDEMVFVLGASHPLASARAITKDDLRHQRLITSRAPAAETRWFMRAVFGRKTPKLQFLHLPLTEAIVDAARAGMGIAVLSEWMTSGYLGHGDLLMKRLASGALRRPWRVAYRREITANAERIVAALVGSAPHLAAARSDRRARHLGLREPA